MNALIMLVCGCVVDAEVMHGAEQQGQVIIECPFCGITFSLRDLAEWSEENRPDIRVHMISAIGVTRPLIKYKDQAFEIIEVCGCGYPIVRKAGGSRKPKHLRVPEGQTVRLFD